MMASAHTNTFLFIFTILEEDFSETVWLKIIIIIIFLLLPAIFIIFSTRSLCLRSRHF